MDALKTVSLLIVISAFLAFISAMYLRVPYLIGVLILAMISALVLWLCKTYWHIGIAKNVLYRIDSITFSPLLINLLLSISVFSGAIRTNVRAIQHDWKSVALFGIFGHIIFVILTGFLFWLLFIWLHIHQSPVYCFLFAAFISPNEPLPISGIINSMRLHPFVRPRITGEALLSKGMGFLLFMIVYQMVKAHTEAFSVKEIAMVILREVGGGLFLGAVIGFAAFYLIKLFPKSWSHIVITLLVFGVGFFVAAQFNVSAAMCVLMAGLFCGASHNDDKSIDAIATSILRRFWEIADFGIYTFLFVFVGLKMMSYDFTADLIATGLFGILIILATRFVTIKLLSMTFNKMLKLTHEEDMIIVWSSIRGAFPFLMMMLIEPSYVHSILIHATYVVVTFSIIVNGLASKGLIRHWVRQGIY